MYTTLLARLKGGEALKDLLPEFAAAKKVTTRKVTADSQQRAALDKDVDSTDSFVVVEAALAEGEITEKQYAAIRSAVLGS